MDIGTIILRSIQTGMVAGLTGFAETFAARRFAPLLFRHGILVSRAQVSLPRFPPGQLPRDLTTTSAVFRLVGPDEAFFQLQWDRELGRPFALFALRGRIHWHAARAEVEQRIELAAPVCIAAWCTAMAGFGILTATVRIDLVLALTIAAAVGIPMACLWGLREAVARMSEAVEEVKPFLSHQAV